jgi:predicted pyridoxine 5'-phosphate oxidase superfamily flavin-nucleotide-binding protein
MTEMNREHDAMRVANDVLDATLYMSLGTVDPDGRARVTPVFFATADDRELVWVSDPRTRHSRNAEARPRIAISVFDSGTPLEGEGYGVTIEARADRPAGEDRDRALETLARRSVAHGGRRWAPELVEPRSPLRVYRAVAELVEVWPEPGFWER